MAAGDEEEAAPGRRKRRRRREPATGGKEGEKESLEEGGPGGDRPDNSGRSRMGGPTKRVRAGRDCCASPGAARDVGGMSFGGDGHSRSGATLRDDSPDATEVETRTGRRLSTRRYLG